jgi:hypothetical protein
MAGSLTNYGEGKVLGELFGGTAFSTPATWYGGFFSAAPSDTSAGTELSGSGYARVSITNNTTNFPAVAAGDPVVNGVEIVCFTATGTLPDAVAFGLFDASSGGNLVVWATLNSNISISNGSVVRIPAGNLSLSLD